MNGEDRTRLDRLEEKIDNGFKEIHKEISNLTIQFTRHASEEKQRFSKYENNVDKINENESSIKSIIGNKEVTSKLKNNWAKYVYGIIIIFIGVLTLLEKLSVI